MKPIVIILFSIAIMLTACKKYPEGGTIKKGPKNILGNWYLTLYEVDGIDSTNLISINTTYDYKNVTVSPKISGNGVVIHPIGGVVYKIEFIQNNEIITGKGDSYYGANPCYPDGCNKEYFLPEGISASWNILQLDSKTLHLQMQGVHYYNLKLYKKN